MIDVNFGEVIVLIVLAVIIFGPDKLPEMARKAARVIAMLRNVANNAQDTVRRELGPEFADMTADLTLNDLRPSRLGSTITTKALSGITSQLQDVQDTVKDAIQPLSSEPGATIADKEDALNPTGVPAIPEPTVEQTQIAPGIINPEIIIDDDWT